MTFPKFVPADEEWAVWFSRFPNLPSPDEFALKWTLTRIDRANREVPTKSKLSKRELKKLWQWIVDYKEQFNRDQKPPRRGST